MIFEIISLFPEIFSGFLKSTLIAKAIERKIIEVNILNPRDFTKDKHRVVDDRPFGGGPGMVLKAEPIYQAIKKAAPERIRSNKLIKKSTSRIIILSPQGKTFNQEIAKRLVKYEKLVLVCGHYEGIDERIMNFVDEEISIGDFVLMGGELPAMVVVEAVSRLIKGVIKEASSVENDSFSSGLLDYPHYTRPRSWRGFDVPDVLLSGNHKRIKEWRKEKSLEVTKKKRPDLFKK